VLPDTTTDVCCATAAMHKRAHRRLGTKGRHRHPVSGRQGPTTATTQPIAVAPAATCRAPSHSRQLAAVTSAPVTGQAPASVTALSHRAPAPVAAESSHTHHMVCTLLCLSQISSCSVIVCCRRALVGLQCAGTVARALINFIRGAAGLSVREYVGLFWL
jgi:hypothetical protein